MNTKTFLGVDITPRSVYRTEIEALRNELEYTKKRLEDSEMARLNANKALHHFSATLENIVEMFGDRLNKIDKTIDKKLCHRVLPKKKE